MFDGFVNQSRGRADVHDVYIASVRGGPRRIEPGLSCDERNGVIRPDRRCPAEPRVAIQPRWYIDRRDLGRFRPIDGSDHFVSSLSLIVVQLAIGGLSALAVAWAAIAYWTGAPWELAGESLLVTAGWALLNAGLVALLARSILQHHHRRKVYRFAVQATGVITAHGASGPMRIVDLSALGVGWESELELAPGDLAWLRFSLGGDEIAAQVRVQGRRQAGSDFRYGGEFASLANEDRRLLVLYLYQRHAPAAFNRRRDAAAAPPDTHEALPTAS